MMEYCKGTKGGDKRTAGVLGKYIFHLILCVSGEKQGEMCITNPISTLLFCFYPLAPPATDTTLTMPPLDYTCFYPAF